MFRGYVLAVLLVLGAPIAGLAASCGNGPTGYDAWKAEFARDAKAAGVGQRGLTALAGTSYASRTIAADRGQKSFKLSLNEFLKKRGADTIIAQGRKRKARDPAFYAALEQRYGVPSGVLLAIHGMETGFGNFMGDANVLSAINTLAYDCRRPDFFRPHAIAALILVDKGDLTSATQGAMHGEVGHTQFLPGNILAYGVDGDGDGLITLDRSMPDALASTANYFRQKGWQPGKGYQPGEPNFVVIQAWNAATVYQQAIALMAGQIDR
jgi:lytic murein transglycosylase